MTIIGSASITIRADDKHFESDVRKAVNKIKNLSITLNADADISKASKKIRDLRHRINTAPAVIKIDADTKKAEEKLRKFLDKWLENDVNFNAVAHTGEANTKLRELTERYKANPVRVTASADTKMAELALAFLSRGRTSRISAVIDPEINAALKGLFNTLTGTLPIEKVKSAIAGVAANFEGLAVKGGIAVTAINAISAAILTTAANILSVGKDITQATGIIAAMPAVIFSVYFALKAHKMAWEGFSEAAHDNSEKANEALMKLPVSAQHAALSLRGLREEVQESVQNAYWDEVGETFTEMVEMQFPSVKKGLTEIGSALGDVSGELFAALRDVGDFNDVFLLVEEGIRNMKDGIKPAIEGLATFVGIGSNRLPQFGKWLGDLGEQFGKFAERAEKNGDILRWIDTGVRRVRELGSIIASTTRILDGLAIAAKMSGAPGLTEFADGFQRVADVVNGEPFQSRLVAVLEGARRGTDKMAEGLGNLMEYLGESSESLGHFLDLAGEITGLSFDSIRTLFDGTGLGSGIYDAMDGIRQGLELMEPGFRDFGVLIGDLGTIAGELFINMAPGLNQLAETLSDVIAALQDGILASMPIFNEFIQAILLAATGPVVALAEGIGNVLEMFAKLPSGIQTVIMSLGLLLALKPRLDGLWRGIAAGSAGAFAKTRMDATVGAAVLTPYGTAVGKIGTAWRNVGRELSDGRALSGFVTNSQRISTAAGAAGRAIGTTAGQGLRLAGGGLMSMLGGPWGIALAGAAVAVGAFAQKQAEADAKVKALTQTIDAQSGAMNGAGKKLVAADILDLDANWFDDLMRSGRRNMEELARDTQLNMKKVTDAVSNPKGRDDFVANWRAIRDAAGEGNEVTEALAKSVGMTAEQFEGLSQTDLNEMTKQIEDAAKVAAEAEREVKALADATGTTTVEATKLAANFETLASATTSVSDKVGALKSNLDIFSGGARSAREAAREQADSIFTLQDSMKSLAEANGTVIDANGRMDDSFRQTLTNADGTFSTATASAIDFSREMDGAAEAILTVGMTEMDRLLDAGKAPGEAAAGAIAAMQGPMDTLRGTLATLGFDTEQVNTIMRELGLDEEQLTGALSVDTADAEAAIARASLMAAAFAEGNYSVSLAALPDEFKKVIGESEELGKLFADGNYEAVLSMVDESGTTKEEFLLDLMEAESAEDVTKILDLAFGGQAEADKAMGTHREFDSLPTASAELDTLYRGKPAVYEATKDIADYDAGPVASRELNARNLVDAPVAHATALVEGYNGKNANANLNATNMAEPATLMASGLVKGYGGIRTNVGLNATNFNMPVVSAAKGLVTSYGVMKPIVPLAATNLTGAPTAGARSNINSVGVMRPNVPINALNLTGPATAGARGNIASVRGKTESINVTTNAENTAARARNAIASIVGKSVDVVTNYISRGGARPGAQNINQLNADGGLYNGAGTRLFANGGIMDSMKAFAGGGVENHTAQIARGAWPVRIWAEPETGGEAYLPLSRAKRPQSLKIFEEVARIFGYGIFKKFADGGIMQGVSVPKTPNVVSARYATGGISNPTSVSRTAPAFSQPVIVVNPSQGLSEEQIGEAAATEWYWQYNNR